jgi:hypothetical protein
MIKPKWSVAEGIRTGIGMFELSSGYADILNPRLDAGRIEGLGADVGVLRGDNQKSLSALLEKNSSTEAQDKMIGTGCWLVSSVREAIRRRYARDPEMKDLFGIGHPVNQKSVEAVARAMQGIIDGADKKPEAVREAGILPADIDEIRAVRMALVSADTDQEGKKLSAKDATAKRVATQLRVEEAVDRIYGAAKMAFRDQPEILAKFEAVLPKSPKASKSKKTAPAT